MTSKAEIRTEEQNEKAESGQENLWNEIQLKGTEQKGVDKFGWFMSKIQIATSPPREGEPAGTNGKEDDEIRTLLSEENNLRQPFIPPPVLPTRSHHQQRWRLIIQ